jgi:hypothetical protein
MAETQVVIRGLDELRRELRRIDPRLAKTLQVANKRVSERVVSKARPAIQGLRSPGGSRAQSGLRARASQTKATVVLLGSNPTIRANVFGTLSHKVFGRNVSGHGPFLPWLGDSWQPEQLYGLGPALTEVVDGFALDEYADSWMNALSAAFPD